MRLVAASVLALVAAACDVTSAEAPASPTPTPSRPMAVMVHRAGLGEPYIVELVSAHGVGGALVRPLSRSAKTFFFSTPCPAGGGICADGETAAYVMPETSISSSRVYFLDGETQVKSMTADGTVTPIKNIDAPANSQVMFAVNPDDSRMAVAIITLASTHQPDASFTEQMYVEDLKSTANRVRLYSSNSLAEWPVAWHGGQIVVATGTGDIANFDNPYGAAAYVLVDPATGQATRQLDCSTGLLVRAGSACVVGGCETTTSCSPAALYREGWDGTRTPLAIPPGPAERIVTTFHYTHLSPDGAAVAAEVVTDVQSGATETVVIKGGAVVYTTQAGAPKGWLDDDHLIIGDAGSVIVVDLATGSQETMTGLVTIPQQGMPDFMGTLPAALG